MSIFAGLSLREIYVKRCRELHCKPNSTLKQQLPGTPDDFESLQHIDVSRNFIGPKGILPLLDVVRCCRQLHSLDLREQRLEQDSVDAVCCALQRHPSLVRLNLSKNPINIASGGLLLDLAKANGTLEYILLEDTAVKETMTVAIQNQLVQNRAAKAVKEQARRESRLFSGTVQAEGASKERMTPQSAQTLLNYFKTSVCSLLFDDNPLQVLAKHCREHNCWFQDVQFSAADETAQRVATSHYNISGWSRLAEIYPDARLFPDVNANRDDMYELPSMSLLGFQWLFTSVVAAAPTVSHLQQLLLTDDAVGGNLTVGASCGAYALRVFIDGAWRYVIIDDFVPVDRTGQPVFCPAVEGREGQRYVWSCLVEKAVAKLHGGYQAIDSDLVRDQVQAKAHHTKPGRPEAITTDPMKADRHTNCFKTMADLSGGVGLLQPLHTDTFQADKWWPIMYQMLSDRHTTLGDRAGSVSGASAAKGSAATKIGTMGTSSDKGRAASCNSTSTTTTAAGAPGTLRVPPMAVAMSRESAKTLQGIQPHHAYQVIRAVQLNGFFLIELANVCERRDSTLRWRGEWSEESPLWSRYPDIDNALRSKHTLSGSGAAASMNTALEADGAGGSIRREDDGFAQKIAFGHASSGRPSFWMSYVDFLKAFEELHCARTFPGTCCGQIDGEWGRRTAGGPLSADTWYTNPHYRMTVAERGTAFISLSVPDRRFTASDVEAIGFHWVKDELFPIYDPYLCGGPQTEQSRFLYRAKYVRTDSICFESSLEAHDDYWFVPSTLIAGQRHRFLIRVFCSVPFVMTEEALTEHWSVTTVSDEVLSSGAFRSGDDNAQVAFQLDDLTRSMHASCAPSLSASNVSISRGTPLTRTTRNNFANSIIGTISADSYSRGAASSTPTGYCIARAIVTPSLHSSPAKASTAGVSRQAAPTQGATADASGNVSLGLFLAFADRNPAGELSRTVGALADDNVVAESPYVLGNRVYCEGGVAASESYTLVCCVQPLETRATVLFTLFSTIPTCKLAVLPAWPKQTAEVQWRHSGSYYEADSHPQVEIFPARAGARFVVHMSMLEYSCGQATITVNVVSNHGRRGQYLVGKIPQERLLARSEYVRDNWVQCSVEIGETDVDSLIAIPCLQPTGSRGACIVTVSSDTDDFHVRVLQGGTAKKNSAKR